MLITVTSEKNIESEIEKINSLFRQGLDILHVRKPSLNKEKYKKWISQIDMAYHKRIMIHQHHELCNDYGLKGVHLKEQDRMGLKNNLIDYCSRFRNKGHQISSSFHSKEAIKNSRVYFDYVLLSPVFNSISKKGYTGKKYDVTDIKQTVIGIGGINTNTMQKAHNLGYKGVAVLGGIWNTKNPIESFINIKKEYELTFKKSSVSIS